MFDERSVVDSGLVGLGFGAYLGLLTSICCANQVTKASANDDIINDKESTAKTKTKTSSNLRKTGRIMLAFLVVGLVAGSMYFIIG